MSITRLPAHVPADAPPTLYFAPLACSLAARIGFYEAGATATYVQVDTKAGRLATGGDFRSVNPLGQVPVLELAPDVRLTENTAVLHYVADRFSAAALAPTGGFAQARFRQWLGFIATELHKAVFVPLLDRSLDASVHAWARSKADVRLDLLAAHLAEQPWLLDDYSIADAYCFVVLNWAAYVGVDLAARPALAAYLQRVRERPAVARAFAEEFALWRQEQQRLAA